MLCSRTLNRYLSMAALLLCSACANGPQELYMWENFPRQQYDSLSRNGVSLGDQIQSIEAHMVKAQGSNRALPPGLRAHLGMLYLQSGNPDKAKELWRTEKSAFPESASYIDQLLKRLEEPNSNKNKGMS